MDFVLLGYHLANEKSRETEEELSRPAGNRRPRKTSANLGNAERRHVEI